jgi:hypothetical protein
MLENDGVAKVRCLHMHQYEVVAARRVAYDQLVWQTPVLSLTAQAFLYQIAYGNEVACTGRLVAAFLICFVSLASIRLMVKHRAMEVQASKMLEEFESSRQPDAHLAPLDQKFFLVHARPRLPNCKGCNGKGCQLGETWIERLVATQASKSSYVTWLCLLFSFFLGGVISILVTLGPSIQFLWQSLCNSR